MCLCVCPNFVPHITHKYKFWGQYDVYVQRTVYNAASRAQDPAHRPNFGSETFVNGCRVCAGVCCAQFGYACVMVNVYVCESV